MKSIAAVSPPAARLVDLGPYQAAASLRYIARRLSWHIIADISGNIGFFNSHAGQFCRFARFKLGLEG
jgi:hypothetical protein